MASQVSICNKALLRVGQAQIQALTEQSTEAAYCRQFYDDIRKTVLRSFAWNFALKFSTVAEVAGQTSYRFAYVYALPADCLRILEVHPSEGYSPDDAATEFETIGQYLHTDMEDAIIKYVFDVTDTTQFDDTFVDALAYRMAAELAMPITRDPNYVGSMMDMYYRTLSAARTYDANENHRVRSIGRSFLNAR